MITRRILYVVTIILFLSGIPFGWTEEISIQQVLRIDSDKNTFYEGEQIYFELEIENFYQTTKWFRENSVIFVDDKEVSPFSGYGMVIPYSKLNVKFSLCDRSLFKPGEHTVYFKISDNLSNSVKVKILKRFAEVDIFLDKDEYSKGETVVITVRNNDSKESIYYRPQVSCGYPFWELESIGEDNIFLNNCKREDKCIWGDYPPLKELRPQERLIAEWKLSEKGLNRYGCIQNGRFRIMFNYLSEMKDFHDKDKLYKCRAEKILDTHSTNYCKEVNIIYSNEFAIK